MTEKNTRTRRDFRRLSDRIESAAELASRQGRGDMAARLMRVRKALRKREAKAPRRRLSDWLTFVQYGDFDQEFLMERPPLKAG